MRPSRSVRLTTLATLAVALLASVITSAVSARVHGWLLWALFGCWVLFVALSVWLSPRQDPPAPTAGESAPGDAAPAGAARTTPAPDALPAETFAFTGRAAELAEIDAAADELVAAGKGVVVMALWGSPGVGKSALAWQAARRRRAWFADGAFAVSLGTHAGEQNRVSCAAALARLLRWDGVSSEVLPADEDERAELWQRRTAGRRVLVVLDDADTLDQVRPLIPQGGACLALVTSRHLIASLRTELGARIRRLDVLPHDDAVRLFVQVADRAFADPRAGSVGEREAVARLVERCDRLPLAITSVASGLHVEPDVSAARLAEEMGGEALTVFAAFDASYRRLPAETQRVLRLWGAHPGVDADAAAVAALAGLTPDQADGCLRTLSERALCVRSVAPAGSLGRGDRYQMHDLVRAFAQTQAEQDGQAACADAVDRLLRHYQRTAADQAAPVEPLLTRHTRPTAAPRAPGEPDLSRRGEASAWFELERANLLACVGHAAANGLDERLVGLVDALAGFLRNNGPWDMAVRLHADAAEAALRRGDLVAHAVALNDLGVMCRLTRDHERALSALEQARALFADLPADTFGRVRTLGQANALNEVGVVSNLMGRHEEAAGRLVVALDLYRRARDEIGMANAAKNLGVARSVLGDPGAADLLDEALGRYQRLADTLGVAEVRNQRGLLRLAEGEPLAALAEFGSAAALAGEAHSVLERARALDGAGRAHLALGLTRSAVRPFELAGELYQSIRADREAGEVMALVAGSPRTPTSRPRAGRARRPRFPRVAWPRR